jgi:hypothetical protein
MYLVGTPAIEGGTQGETIVHVGIYGQNNARWPITAAQTAKTLPEEERLCYKDTYDKSPEG